MNEIEPALRRAYALGQKYWQQADSDFARDHRKADETQAKFNQLVESMTTDTLQARCAEIVGWRKTGILTGDVLRQLANERHGDEHDALGRAENDTIQEELELVAARRAQPAREPLTSQQVWENHEIMSVNAMLMEDLMRIVRAVEAAHGITQKDAG